MRCPNCGAGEEHLVAREMVVGYMDYEVSDGVAGRDVVDDCNPEENGEWYLICLQCGGKVEIIVGVDDKIKIIGKDKTPSRRDVG